jgi:hypothetical protein
MGNNTIENKCETSISKTVMGSKTFVVKSTVLKLKQILGIAFLKF